MTAGGTATNPSGAITEIVTNSGELHVTASANANGGNDNFADADAAGVVQDAGGSAQSFDRRGHQQRHDRGQRDRRCGWR